MWPHNAYVVVFANYVVILTILYIWVISYMMQLEHIYTTLNIPCIVYGANFQTMHYFIICQSEGFTFIGGYYIHAYMIIYHTF